MIFGNLLKPTKRTKIENSPNKFLRSFSFSVAGANSSGSASDSGGLHRRSLFRTQSECISQQSQQSSQSSVGFRQPLTEEHKRVSLILLFSSKLILMGNFPFTEIIVGSFVGPSQQTNFQRSRKI